MSSSTSSYLDGPSILLLVKDGPLDVDDIRDGAERLERLTPPVGAPSQDGRAW